MPCPRAGLRRGWSPHAHAAAAAAAASIVLSGAGRLPQPHRLSPARRWQDGRPWRGTRRAPRLPHVCAEQRALHRATPSCFPGRGHRNWPTRLQRERPVHTRLKAPSWRPAPLPRTRDTPMAAPPGGPCSQ
eukprot:365540-Chlamydomonas_euryale.AAC.12